MTLREGFVEVDGGRLHYQIDGEGDPLVLLHGFGLDARMWDGEVERFGRDHAVVRYDLRGFGRSTLPTAPFTHFGDLRALLLQLGLARVDLVGLSMGGGVAVDFALSHPELLRSLVLVDTIVGGFKWRTDGKAMGAAWAAAKTGGLPAARAAWLANPLFAPALEDPEVAARLRTMVDDYSGWHFLNDSPQRPLEPPAWERLASIATRTLVLVGARDLADFRDIAARLTRDLPQAQSHVVEGAGHMLNLEAPARFHELVARFLAEAANA